MKIREYIPDHAVTTIPALAFLFVAHYFLFGDEPDEQGIELSAGAPAYYDHWQRLADQDEFDIDANLERLELDDAERDRLIRDLLHRGEYQRARTQLLEVAAAAVLRADQQRLGDTMLLLGEVAINQQELGAAEIYLNEALFLNMERDDVIGTARSYQLLGELNIRARELARRASNTYDDLWQARNSIARGYYQGVDENLQRVIAENLAIKRYGAAADAWEALASMHDRVHDGYQAQLARIEAAKLFASTGQMTHVRRLLDGLDRGLISDSDLAETWRQAQLLFDRHQQDQVKTSQAHDYQVLYHHYLRQGQVERAWRFRIKSSETLANTSERALFQRQADIIAVLYNSNFAMERARDYLDRAGNLFEHGGVAAMLEATRDLKTLVF